MSKGKGRPRRRLPQRTCVGCRRVEAKRSLTRLVRTPQGIEIDPSGKAPGRGAYLHDQAACWEVALRGPLARALRTELKPEVRDRLLAYMKAEFTEKQHG